jgi:hypothetical protein
LGEAGTALWGRDFTLAGDKTAQAAPNDWGDRDLREAIEYARAVGKRVLGVIAGHMHRRPGAGSRPLCVEQEQILYVNPAVVPRVFSRGTGRTHHHVGLRLNPKEQAPQARVQVKDCFIELSSPL